MWGAEAGAEGATLAGKAGHRCILPLTCFGVGEEFRLPGIDDDSSPMLSKDCSEPFFFFGMPPPVPPPQSMVWEVSKRGDQSAAPR